MPKQNVLGNMRRKQVTTEEDLPMDLFWKGIGRRGGGIRNKICFVINNKKRRNKMDYTSDKTKRKSLNEGRGENKKP